MLTNIFIGIFWYNVIINIVFVNIIMHGRLHYIGLNCYYIYMYERIYDVENYVIQKKNLRIKEFGEFISGINYLVKVTK